MGITAYRKGSIGAWAQGTVVTHELTEIEVEMRMDMMWGAMVNEKEPKEVKIKTRDESGKFDTIVDTRPSVYDIDAVSKSRDVMMRFGGRLIIKKYPINTCTMEELNRFLDYLEQFEKSGVWDKIMEKLQQSILDFFSNEKLLKTN